jgi:hypothetical protein
MGYTIVRVNADDHAIRREMLLPHDSTRSEAVATIEKHLASYVDHGWDGLHDLYWAEDEGGEHYELWLEAWAGGPKLH